MAINYFARPSIKPQLPAAAAPENEQPGMFGNLGRAAGSGALSAVGGIFDFVGAEGVAKQFYGWSDDARQSMSQEAQQDMAKPFFDENEQGDIELGEGLADLDTWLLTLASVAGQAAPTMIPGAGLAGAATKVAKLGATGAKVATAAGMGLTGGAAATGQGMEQARQEYLQMPDEIKAQSELFRKTMKQINTERPGMDADSLWNATDEAIAAKLADDVRKDPATLLANFAGSAIADPIIGKALTGARLAKSGAFRSAAKGFAIEGSTEAGQAGVQEYGVNKALAQVDGRDPTEGVAVAALNEGVAGGAFGASAGLLGGFANRKQDEPVRDKDADAIRESNPDLAAAFDSAAQSSAQRQADMDIISNLPAVSRPVLEGELMGTNVPSTFADNQQPLREQRPFTPYAGQIEDKNIIFGTDDRSYDDRAMQGEFMGPEGRPEFMPSGLIDLTPIDTQSEQRKQAQADMERMRNQPRQIADKNVIFAGDGRPQQAAQEFTQNLQRSAEQSAAVPRLPQKDIIFAGDQSGVTVKGNGLPFQSPKEALASKSARVAKKAGQAVEAVKFGDGWGWQPAKAPAADLAGEQIDKEWTAFADNTGTLKIPRAEMPQIKAEHRGAMVQFMKGRDITHEQDTVQAETLKPTQTEFSPAKVKKAMDYEGGNRSILISSDGYVLDGHHQWLAARENGGSVDVIRLNAPIKQLLPLALEFPSSTTADGAQDGSISKGAEARQAIQGRTTGKASIATTPAGRDIDVEYQVVEADSLVTSNLEDGRSNPDFPSELQPRDRSRAASMDQINRIAGAVNPRLLSESPTTSDGAPIISADGIVESGNGRSLGLKKAYRNGGAEGYRQYLTESGFDVEGMKQPVLVRVRRTDLSPEERQAYIKESNQRTTLEMSATEQAASDAAKMAGVVADYQGGEITSAENRNFVRKFMQNVAGEAERGGLMDSSGILSQNGRRRIEAALLSTAYGDDGIVAEVFESGDTDIKAIGGALLDAAGKWAQMRNAQRDGMIADGMDVTPFLLEAVNLIRRARAEGKALIELVSTDDIFSGSLPDATRAWLSIFYRGDTLSRARGRDKVAADIMSYADEALKTQPGDGLFGDVVTSDQIMGVVSERNKNQEGSGAQQGGLFTAGNADTVESGAQSSREGQRSSVERTNGPDREQPEKPAVTAEQPPQAPADAGVSVSGPTEKSTRTEKLQDVGAILLANKKSWFSGMGIKWSDIAGENDTLKLKLTTKSKVWPKPNWESIIDSVPDAERDTFAPIVHMVKQVYDAIATAPSGKSDQNLQDYIEAVTKVKDAAESLLSDKQAQGKLWSELGARAERRLSSPYSIGTIATKSDMAPIFAKVFPLVAGGSKFKRGERENDLAVQLGSKAIKTMQFDAGTAVKALQDISKGWPTKQEAWQKQGYAVVELDGKPEAVAGEIKRPTGNVYSARVNFKTTDGGSFREFLGTFDTEQEALKTANDFAGIYNKPVVLISKRKTVISAHDDIEAATEAARAVTRRNTGKEVKEQPLQAADVERVGVERRIGGKDVTAQELMDSFGFTGINFGNWVKADERQWFVNQTYDSFYDLAEILGLPPKAMSLNGMLGVAFGAQGNSGAAAHFVPGFNEINLTKNQGAGALAHEWGHALDHYFGVMSGMGKSDAPYASELANLDYRIKNQVRGNLDTDSGIRKVIYDAFVDITSQLKEQPETMEQNRERIKASQERALSEFNALTEQFESQLSTAGKDALKALRDGKPGDYADIPPPKGKRKSPGAVYGEVMQIANELPEVFSDLRMINALHSKAVSVRLTTEALSDEPALRRIHTDFYAKSRGKDASKGGKVYWSTPVEMFARAFESFVMDQMAEREQRNDFLVRPGKNDAGETNPEYPYPAGTERKNFNAAFNKLIEVIETKETDKGTMLFSKQNTIKAKPAKGVNSKLAKQFVNGIMQRLNGAAGIKVVVLESQAEAEKLWQMSLAGDLVRGAYNRATNTAYVIVENIKSMDELREVVAHEVIGHGGLQNVISKADYKTFIERLKQTRNNRAFAEQWAQIDSDYEGFSENDKAEELFAYFVQNKPVTGPVKFWWNALKRWLHKALVSVGLAKAGDPDIEAMQDMLESIRAGFMFSRGGAVNVADSELAFKKPSSREESFARWFGDSKIVNDDGSPKIVYHGSANNGIEVFEPAANRKGHQFNQDQQGIYFSPVADYANFYAMERRAGDPTLYPVYLSIQNPLIIDGPEPVTSGLKGLVNRLRYGRDRMAAEKSLNQFRSGKRRTDWVYKEDIELLKRAGYDGIINEEHMEYIVFEPTQIKSATGNNGDFDPSNPDIRFSKTRSTEQADALDKLGLGEDAAETVVEQAKRRANETVDTLKSSAFWQRLNEGIFDGLAGIKQAEEAAGITDPNKQGYVSARLASGLSDILHGVFHYGAPEWRDGVVQRKADTKGLLEVFGMLGDDLNDWLAWMGANRAERLMAEGRENNLSQADIDELKAMAAGKEALFEEVRQEYNKINSAIIDLAEEAGLISAEQRGGFDEEWYVPFFRNMENEVDPEMAGIAAMVHGPRSRKGLVGQSAQIKELKGGRQSTKDLLENIIHRQSTMIDAAIKNKAMAEVVSNLEGTPFMQAVDSPDIAALSQTELNLLQKVKVMRNGKAEAYTVTDPALLRGLLQIHTIGNNSLFNRMARSAKRFLTAGITLSPDFIIKNFVRDAAHAWMINKDGFRFGADSVKGLRKAFAENEAYRDLIFSGAAFQGGYVHGADPEAAAQQIRRALRSKGLGEKDIQSYMDSLITKGGELLEAYRTASDKVENANRLSTYEAALASGKSRRQAAYEAKDLMDYSLKGNFAMIGTMIDMLPFFNARLQGMSKLVRSMKAGDGDRVLKVLSANLAMKGLKVAAFSLALAAMNDDDERYQELPDWDKDANWHFFIGDEHFRIPKPFELGILFGTMPERMFHYAAGSQPGGDLGKAAAHAVWNTLALNPIPQLALPVVEVMTNKSFFKGSQIEGMGDAQRQPEDRYNAYTSETAKQIGAAFGVSPKMVEHLILGYTGTLGGYVLGMADVAASQMLGIEKADTPISRYPVIKAFYQGDAPKTATKFQDEFYDALQSAGEAYGSYKRAVEEGDVVRQQELKASESQELGARIQLNRIQRKLSELNKQAELVNNNQNMGGTEKRQKLDDIARRKNELYQNAYVRHKLGEW